MCAEIAVADRDPTVIERMAEAYDIAWAAGFRAGSDKPDPPGPAAMLAAVRVAQSLVQSPEWSADDFFRLIVDQHERSSEGKGE